MNYECIKDFIALKTGEEYYEKMRISETELLTLTPEEQKNFKPIKGESFNEQVQDMIQREDHLENE